MNAATFQRQRARIEQRFPVGRKRTKAMDALVRDAGAAVVIVDRKAVAWRMPSGESVCVKRRYPNDDSARMDLERIRDVGAGHLPTRVYDCARCAGVHLTSQAKR